MALALALLCLAGYWATLSTVEFFHDSQALIVENRTLRSGLGGLPGLFRVGYWEAVQGEHAPVKQYRPVLMTTFLLQVVATGFSAPPLHAVNLLLHWLVSLLLWTLLKRRLRARVAAAAALLFAVLPVQTEAVALIPGRSELLCAALMLGAWLCLDEDPAPGRLAAGGGLYALALLTKESSLLFPFLLAADDWAHKGLAPWSARRRRVHALLWVLLAAYFLVRLSVLSHSVRGGHPYFPDGRLVAALTYARFFFLHYARPALTGTGLCTDYSRPFFPDADPAALGSWLWLAALAAPLAWAAWRLLKERSRPAFWLLGPLSFLLPTSNLVFALDTIGAERFLYFPSISLCVAWGALYALAAERRPRAAAAGLCALLGWSLFATVRRCQDWTSRVAYYRAAVACNPVSGRARSALGGALIQAGLVAEGEAELAEGLRLNPHLSGLQYNVGRHAFEKGDLKTAERHLRLAIGLNPHHPDAITLLGLVLEARGRRREALVLLHRSEGEWPWHALTQFNLGRLTLLEEHPAEARMHFKRFLELAPDDHEAAGIRALVAEIEARRASPAR